ncbi:tape measure protein [Pseudoxanthomonas sp. SE1]|uniref:tape measure protein n=1 Tax=Pseudoxanthomonas sp. SE1 TaxID=1664560 RepID=UPI00240DFCD6|nr:tape measure protein [Pseudoxanthomonas sp. SE1]WFC43259.1 tape measure protein [Pseudoxanthomonas sp. SE1]
MATNSGASLRVRVSADLADLKQGMALLRGELAKVQKASARAAPDDSRWASGLKSVRNQLAGIVTVYGALRAVKTYAELADQAANLSARLRLATKDQQAFEGAYRGTYEIAQRTSSEWNSVAGLYARLSQSTSLGQNQILALTETIGQTFQVSGAGAQEADRGITQLTQAIAGGVLRAEEFNTLIETAPRLVQALADHFGVSFGKVRKLVNDGKVSTQDLLDALEKSADAIQEEFTRLPLTVSRATQQLKTSLLALVGGADEATGASGDLANAISGLAGTLSDPATVQAFQGFITLLTRIAGAGVKAAARVGDLIETARIASGSVTLDRASDAGLRERLTQLQANIDAGKEWRKEQGNILERLSGGRDTRAYDQMVDEARRIQGILDIRENGSSSPGNGRRYRPTGEVSTTTAGRDGGGTEKRIAESNALLRDSVTRALAELDRLYAGHEVGLKDYFAERQRLQEQAIDLEIQQARNEMAVTKDAGQRRNLEEQIVKLQRDRAALGTTTAREQAAAEADLAKQLEAVKLELLELDGKTGEAARLRLEQEYKDLFKRLEAASDESGKAIVRNLIERNVTKAQLDDFRTRASDVLGNLQATEGSVSAQVDARTLGAAEGERRLQAVRAKSLEQLTQLRAAVAAFYEKTKDPSVLAFLTSLDGNIADVTMSMQEFRMKMEDQAESSFGQFISDLVEGTKSFKEAFADMVRSFAAGVAQMIAQELALRAIRAALSAFGGASGSAPAAHGGGIAGRLQMTRNNINPMVFGHAPRYHGGGVAGLANNEIPAILERGETIRTKAQESALTAQLDAARSGNRQGLVTTPIVAIGDNAIADALQSAAGTQAVLTIVRDHWGGLNQGGTT